MDKEKILNEFMEKMIENMEDMDSEFAEVTDENFWELIGD